MQADEEWMPFHDILTNTVLAVFALEYRVSEWINNVLECPIGKDWETSQRCGAAGGGCSACPYPLSLLAQVTSAENSQFSKTITWS